MPSRLLTCRIAASETLLKRLLSPLNIELTDEGADLEIALSEELKPGEVQKVLAEVAGLQMSRTSVGYLFTYRGWRALLTDRRLEISANLPAGGDELSIFRDFFIKDILLAFFRRRGLYELHAAGVERDGRGVLIVGQSLSGKTSAVVSLVEVGWGYTSDDALLLRTAESGRMEVFPFRRTFSIRQDTLERVGWLKEYVVEESLGKHRVRPQDVWPESFREVLEPHILIFPSIVEGEVSMLLPINKLEALVRLTGASAWLMLDCETASAHMAVFKMLAERTNAYELRAGSNLLTDRRELSRLLEAVF